MDDDPHLSSDDVKALQTMDPLELSAALHKLSPEKQKSFILLISELLQVSSKPSKKAIKRPPVKRPRTLSSNENQKFLTRMLDIEHEVKYHVSQWQEGHSLLSCDLTDDKIANEEIGTIFYEFF